MFILSYLHLKTFVNDLFHLSCPCCNNVKRRIRCLDFLLGIRYIGSIHKGFNEQRGGERGGKREKAWRRNNLVSS